MSRITMFVVAACLLIGRQAAATPVPVVHWTFDGGSAANVGSGGSALDGTVYGDPTFTNGMGGAALVLDGVDDVVACNYQLPDQGSIALWYTPDSFYNWNTIFDNSAHNDYWEMWIYDNSMVRFRVGPPAVEGQASSGQLDFSLNSLNSSNHWYHIVVTWDRAAALATMYVNGVLRQSRTIELWQVPGSIVYIGGGRNTKGKGQVDDVRIYDVALTEEQVRAVHAELAEQTPMISISFDESEANRGASGGARYDAVLYGAPIWTNGLNHRGKALMLDGMDDYVAVSYKLPSSGSVSLWYYVPGPWYNYNSIFDNSAHENCYECWADFNGNLQFRPGDRGGFKTVHNLGGGSNRWYHVVCTWDAVSSNMTLYANGVERSRVVNMSGEAWQTPGATFYIGGGHPGNTHGRGAVSDLQIFEAALPPERVRQLFETKRMQQGGLKAYVPFDGTAEDVVGGHAVVLSGSPTFVKTQGGFYKGLSCAGVGSQDHASISNVMGSMVGTIALWYYARGPWYDFQTIFDNSAHGDHWECWIYASGVLQVRTSRRPDNTNVGTMPFDLNTLRGSNSWYHIAYVWDRGLGQTQLYVDGVFRASADLNSHWWTDPHPTLHLGGGNPGNTKGNGIWDEVRVYDRALTDAEIAALTVIPPMPPPRGTLILLH